LEEAAERIELLREGYMPADPDEKLEPSCQFGVDVLAYATKAIRTLAASPAPTTDTKEA